MKYESNYSPLNFNEPFPLVDMNVTFEYMHLFPNRAEAVQADGQNGDRLVARCVQYHHRLLE
jgi:hypothetical protein